MMTEPDLKQRLQLEGLYRSGAWSHKHLKTKMNIRIINKNENQWLAAGIGVSRCISVSMIIAWQRRSVKAGQFYLLRA